MRTSLVRPRPSRAAVSSEVHAVSRMSEVSVPAAARPVRATWEHLATPATPSPPAFTPSAVGGLPEPARRWLAHAIAEGTALATSVVLDMRGEIRLGRWRRFTATQVLAPDGFVWAATARVGGLPVSGFDCYGAGSGRMRWLVFGALPVMRGSGPDITRSAAGRLAAEATVLLPTAFHRARWSSDAGPDVATATWRIADGESVRIRTTAAGALTELVMARWGNPDGEPFGRVPVRRDGGGRTPFRRHRDSRPVPGRVVVGHGAAGRGRVLPGRGDGRALPLTTADARRVGAARL